MLPKTKGGVPKNWNTAFLNARLEFSYCRDDFLPKGFERCNFVNIRHVEYHVGEAHFRELADTTENTIDSIFPGEMDSSE